MTRPEPHGQQEVRAQTTRIVTGRRGELLRAALGHADTCLPAAVDKHPAVDWTRSLSLSLLKVLFI